MTIVAGLKTDNSRVMLGADCLGATLDVSSLPGYRRADPKLFRNGPYIVGMTGRFRLAQIMRHHNLPSPPSSDKTSRADAWMERSLAPHLRALFESNQLSQVGSTKSAEHLMLAWSRHLYVVWLGDFQYRRTRCGYDAIGCGEPIAQGALAATAGLGLNPRQRINRALRAAEAHSIGVARPFTILRTR